MEPDTPSDDPFRTDATAENGLTVVGIGASAGGLAALKEFFQHIPEDSGLAWVVVVHLSPEHESHLAEILQPHVRMPVQQVTETLPLEVDRVYVIPPNANLSAVDTHLRLSDLEARRRERAPIDHFFRTLARTHDGSSVGIILTGTGSDGALGVKAIKEKNGLTVVQDPNEAAFDGMPQSAISTGLVDLILPLAEIPEAVLRFAQVEPKVPIPADDEEVQAEEARLLHKTFAQIRARTGRDFSRYKRSTILRRIRRRMQLRHVEELSDYVDLLREQPGEVRALADDLLITVTTFFRDAEVFEALEAEVIPQLFEGRGAEDDLRVWSVGCATGEEAYSLAILFLEAAARHEAPPRVQIFASDLHDKSLARARDGFYPGDIETDVSPERLDRFFEKEDGGYRVRKEVRELVVFAPHNLLGDPPFSRLDLVACRNVLIYLEREVQKDVVELFHYALRPGGWLVLGTSETVDSGDLFRVEDKKRCVYRKRNVRGPEPRLPVFPLTRPRLPGDGDGVTDRSGEPVAYGVLHQRMVERYAPPSLLVSPDDKVVHLSEHAGRYLALPGGGLTASAFKLVREELRVALRSALHAAREGQRAHRSNPVSVRVNGEARPVVLHVRPALEPEGDGYVLVIFDERDEALAPALGRAETGAAESEAPTESVRALEDELGLSQQRLQAIVEEYETSQEELKASNEELQSANEELRSTLEELETSKEELQSMNEELQTVNQENRHKVVELAQLSGDLQNLMAGTEIATLFLGRDLRILRFTPRTTDLFSVRPADRGRPLADFTHRLGSDDIIDDARRVLDTLVPVEREVQDEAGRWYLTAVRPYRSPEDVIEGVVITFVDITRRRTAEEALRQSEERYRLLVESAREYAILMLDVEGRITVWSAGAERVFGYAEAEVLGRPAALIFTEEDRADGAPEREVATAAETGRAGDERWHVRKGGERFWASGVLEALYDGEGAVRGFAKILRDNTHRKEAEDALRQSEERFRQAVDAAGLGTWSYSVAEGLTRHDERARAIFGVDRETLAPDEVMPLIHPDDREAFVAAREAALDPAEPDTFAETHRIVRPDGEVRWVRGQARVLFEGEGADRTPVRAVGVIIDVTEQRAAEAALRESEERFRRTAETVPDILFTATPDGAITYVNPRFEEVTGRPAAEALGTTMWEALVHPDDREAAAAVFEDRRGRAEPYEARHRLLLADGTYCWHLTRAQPVRDADGEVAAWYGTATDIDRIVRAEEEVQALNATLERRVRQRTALARRLLARLAAAEEAERKRIAQILHDDLQQRLYGLGMTLSLLRRAGADAALVERAEATLGGAADLARSLSTELSPTVLDTTDLDELFEWLAEHARIQYGLVIETAVEPGTAVADLAARVAVYQILRELLFNVVKHAGVGEARLVARPAGREVHIVVEDEGEGFDPSSLAGEGTAGTGLGLASAQSRLDLVGGRVEIESAAGRGTRVTLIVPREGAAGSREIPE